MCTTALFLSGYAIQLRTLRQLRAAIRAPPEPSPKIFLPDRFRKSTTELADGTVVVIDDDDDDYGSQDGVAVVEVKPSVPAEHEETSPPAHSHDAEEEDERQDSRIFHDTTPETAEQDAAQKPVTADPPPSGGEEDDDEDKAQKEISRAERRRRIKEEIKRLSVGKTPVYYQRRLY